MDSNKRMWEAVKILMQKSFWGKTSSMDSLIRNLRNEVQEFIEACNNDDELNAKEEAADILMLLTCILYKFISDENYSPDELSDRVTEKLHWRYKHLYTDAVVENEEEEFERWADAKKIEHRLNLMFCDNALCPGYKKPGVENIQYKNGKFWCKSCKKEIISSRNNTLFYDDKRAGYHVKEICTSIIEFGAGNEQAAWILSVDQPRIFKAMCNQLLDGCCENGMGTVFMEFVQKKYHIAIEDIYRYFNYAERIREKMNTKELSLTEKYYQRIQERDYSAKNSFTIAEWERISRDLFDLTFDVEKKIEKVIHFSARTWDNQVVHKYLLRYPDKNSETVIECMTLIHYKGAKVKDLTIELSNMYNCIVGCRFCASGALPGKVQYMEAMDYVRQFNTCLSQSGINPEDFENLYVSFAGVGEPSVLYENVTGGMAMMRDLYPNVQFNIATFGYKKECFTYWKKQGLPIRTLQLPLYHTEFSQLRSIVANIPEDYDLSEVILQAVDYRKEHKECRIKINYIPMLGINDTDVDVAHFIKVLAPFKRDISIKVSFLNYTKPAEENGYITPGEKRLEEIKNMFVQNGYKAYVFGSPANTALGCGQLAQNCISGKS